MIQKILALLSTMAKQRDFISLLNNPKEVQPTHKQIIQFFGFSQFLFHLKLEKELLCSDNCNTSSQIGQVINSHLSYTLPLMAWVDSMILWDRLQLVWQHFSLTKSLLFSMMLLWEPMISNMLQSKHNHGVPQVVYLRWDLEFSLIMKQPLLICHYQTLFQSAFKLELSFEKWSIYIKQTIIIIQIVFLSFYQIFHTMACQYLHFRIITTSIVSHWYCFHLISWTLYQFNTISVDIFLRDSFFRTQANQSYHLIIIYTTATFWLFHDMVWVN